MYPVNWQSLLEQHAQDATIVLIDGTIVHANTLAISLLNAKNLNEITGLRWNAFLKTFQIVSTQSGVRQNSLNHEALHHEKEILEMIALDNPLNQILQDVCDRMERLLDNGSICAIMLLDQSSRCLQLAAAPSFEPELLAQIENLKIKPSMWTCGVAMERQQICVTEDIRHDPHWSPTSPSAANAGFRSCWSVPIKTAFNSLLGTVDIYHKSHRHPSEDEQTLMMDAMHVIALAIDKKNMEHRLASSEDRYRSVVNNLTEGIMVIAHGGRILTCNPSAQRILKIGDIELTGRRHRYFKHMFREDESEIRIGEDPASQVFRNGQSISNLSIGLQLQDHTVVWLLVNIQPIVRSHQHASDATQVDAVLISFTDTTEVRETERQLQYIATHDALTGLPNRHQLQQRLAFALTHTYDQKVAVLFLDLDHFKNVNDTAGHAAGDGLLCDVASRLSSCIRATDMLARLGGDEFVIVVDEFSTAQHLQELAERILTKMREPFVIDEHQYHLGTSIGISVFP
ncbi:MAG: diguanylate cyclase, partial [Burkholderiales bacterium]|nr:diguanylate cyclase [Burkholderiales bacterium]